MPTNTTATAHKSKYPQWSNGNWPSPVLPSGILRPSRVPDFFMPAQPFRRVGFAQKIYCSPLTWRCEQRIYGTQIDAIRHAVSAFHQMQCIHRLQSYNIYLPPSKHIAVNLPLLFSTTLTIKQYNESGGANWPRLILNLGTHSQCLSIAYFIALITATISAESITPSPFTSAFMSPSGISLITATMSALSTVPSPFTSEDNRSSTIRKSFHRLVDLYNSLQPMGT